ncbi:restriction endonuclease subunit S [Desulfovibrio sp. JY]|nr:restriction endonuclease subunit S [Desulfovibrio sp. JY]
MNAARLLEYFDRIAEAPDAVSRLRKFILDLAVRGKLVEQDPNDEPASELLKKIHIEKSRLFKNGRIKRVSSTNELQDDDIPFDLPHGWEWSQLSEIGVISPRNNLEGKIEVAFVPMKLIPSEYGARHGIEVKLWSDIKTGFTHFAEGDVALAKITPCFENGKSTVFCNLPGGFGAGTTELHVVRPLLVIPDYVLIFLKSPQFIMAGIPKMTGTAGQKRVSTEYFSKSPFPLPPLAEQHRIVTKVDELMALCDRLEASQAKRENRRDRLASASLKRIGQPEGVGNGEEFRENVRFHLRHLPRLATRPEHVKELRQTILNLAVRGKLVPQDPNDEPASELLKKIHLEKVKLISSRKLLKVDLEGTTDEKNGPFQLPIGWSWARFPELGMFGRGKSKHRPRNDAVLFDGGTHYFIQTGDVARSNGVIKTYTSKYNEIGLAQSAKWPAGTLCITIAANIADSGILSFDACFPDSVVGFIPARVYDNARYFEYFVRTAKADLLEFAPATAQKNINLNILNSVLIPLPPLAEQHRIVAKVDELMTICDKLEIHLATNQTNQSRLLEATLCDALGVTCLPVSRQTRPALSPTRVAATHTDQPPRPITPRPGPVETPTAAVQGSLVEQPTPQVGKPRAANGDIPGAILVQMQPGQEYSRAQLAEALGLSVYEWNMAIRELKESGRVVQTGERRGARYRVL